MKQVFADTHYWVAIVDPKDSSHDKAKEVSKRLGQVIIVTTEMILVEFANFFRKQNFHEMAKKAIGEIQNNPNVRVIKQTSLQFQSALALYGSHKDKEWSLTDCASILIMKEQGIQEVLTHDQHFTQAGFTILL